MALSRWEIDARNQQIADAQAAIVAGDAAKAQSIVDNLIGGSRVGGAQAALQGAINNIPAPSSVSPSGGETNNNTNNGGGNTGGSTSFTSYPSTPTSTPPSPYWIRAITAANESAKGIRQADPDIIIDPEIDTSGDFIVERFFEELGGTELISISRHDLIDGINVVYNPIANLSRLRRRFNPNNIIALDYLSENEFNKTPIDLISRGIYEPYFDDNGDLVVEIDIIRPEENIETEISQSGTVSRIEL